MVARHGPALLRVAIQFSLCHDDALDAYQRALEIYLRRLASVDPATEGAWMRVVVKHEAMAIRRTRLESVDHEEAALDERAHLGRDVDDEIAGGATTAARAPPPGRRRSGAGEGGSRRPGRSSRCRRRARRPRPRSARTPRPPRSP